MRSMLMSVKPASRQRPTARAAEVGVVEALHAEADAADGELGVELAEVVGGEVVGVGLQGDLAAG